MRTGAIVKNSGILSLPTNYIPLSVSGCWSSIFRSSIFRSCIFHPCHLVLHFQVLHFQFFHLFWSSIFRSSIFSPPWHWPVKTNKHSLQTPHFGTWWRRALFDLPQTLHGDRARRAHHKSCQPFFDPIHSFSAKGKMLNFGHWLNLFAASCR